MPEREIERDIKFDIRSIFQTQIMMYKFGLDASTYLACLPISEQNRVHKKCDEVARNDEMMKQAQMNERHRKAHTHRMNERMSKQARKIKKKSEYSQEPANQLHARA